MEQLLYDFSSSQPENINAWLWQDTSMSDVTLRLATELVAQPVIQAVTEAITADISAAPVSELLLRFDSAHRWCSRRWAAGQESMSKPDDSKLVFFEERLASAAHPPSLLDENFATPTLPSGIAFHVHALVLCSNSAYFRARITSAVGASNVGSKRGRVETMDEAMEEDECEAAAAVLQFFYTSQLAGQKGGCCSATFLLQMMKVRVTHMVLHG